jgi:membrane protease YdiL (CAAX protease family)
MKKKETHWRYVAVVFVVSYLWQGMIFLTGGTDSTLFPFVMWIPGIIAVIFRLVFREGFHNVGWGLRRWRFLLPALFVPPLLVLACILCLSALGWATWSDTFFIFRDGMVDITRVPLLLGNQTQSIPLFVVNFGLSLSLQAAIGSIFTIGEEFGWQGYLLQKLIRSYGLNRGLLLLGIIWGYWHLPIILMGYNFPNHPYLGALVLMPMNTICLAIFFAWLYLRSQSIWIPTLTHASANLTATFLINGLVMSQVELARQLVWIATWGLLAIPCLFSLNRERPVVWQATIRQERPISHQIQA